jgi:hypothetical protein
MFVLRAVAIKEIGKKMPSRRTAFFKLRIGIVIWGHLPGVVSWLVHLHRQLLSGRLQYLRHLADPRVFPKGWGGIALAFLRRVYALSFDHMR